MHCIDVTKQILGLWNIFILVFSRRPKKIRHTLDTVSYILKEINHIVEETPCERQMEIRKKRSHNKPIKNLIHYQEWCSVIVTWSNVFVISSYLVVIASPTLHSSMPWISSSLSENAQKIDMRTWYKAST